MTLWVETGKRKKNHPSSWMYHSYFFSHHFSHASGLLPLQGNCCCRHLFYSKKHIKWVRKNIISESITAQSTGSPFVSWGGLPCPKNKRKEPLQAPSGPPRPIAISFISVPYNNTNHLTNILVGLTEHHIQNSEELVVKIKVMPMRQWYPLMLHPSSPAEEDIILNLSMDHIWRTLRWRLLCHGLTYCGHM